MPIINQFFANYSTTKLNSVTRIFIQMGTHQRQSNLCNIRR